MILRLPHRSLNVASILGVLIGIGCHSSLCSAGFIVAEHSGGADPLTQGWSINGGIPAGVTVGSVTESASFGGLNAWFVDDDSSAGGSAALYRQALSNQQLADAQNFGWTLRANLRAADVSDDPGSPGGSVRLRMSLVDRIFNINIGTEGDGDPIVSLTDRNGTDVNYLNDGGGNGYHLYELIYDATSMTADLWIDGTQRVAGYSGYAPVGTTSQEVLWGSGSSADQGQGNYNLVQFELANVTVPEPSSACVFAIGGVCLVVQRRRRHISVATRGV